MENTWKYISGVLVAIAGFFAPIRSLILCAAVFVAIDFVTGIIAGRKRALASGKEWGIESGKAWKTVYKLGFIMAGIVLAWMIDGYILSFMGLRLANLFTGFACGVEFWSYLENAAEISEHPVFRWLKRYMKSKIGSALGDEEADGE